MSEIKKSVLSFPVMFQKVGEVSEGDDRFTQVRIWLMHLGQNFNGSIFEQPVVDDAIPTLEYIPIVGFIEDDSTTNEKDFSDHRYILTKDEKGVRRKYIGNSYGVIKNIDDNNAHYEERLCDDGVTRTFLVVDGLLWNMFEDSSDIMNRDFIKSNSMELWEPSVEGYEDEKNIFHFTKFSFRAACILGKNYEPGMINSTIEVQFTLNNFVKSIQDELSNKLNQFTKITQKNKGGNKMLNTDFSQTVMNMFEDIANIVSDHEQFTDRWGDKIARYRLQDIQDNEVIVVDRQSHYQVFGFPFTLNGDKAEIDFACGGSRKKVRYENYEEGTTAPLESSFDFGKEIESIETKAVGKVTEAVNKQIEAESDYSKIKTEYDEIKPKYDSYVKADETAKEEAVKEQKKSLFERFDSFLADKKEYKELKEKQTDFSVEDIEGRCAIMYTRKNLSAKGNGTDFSKKPDGSASVEIPESHNGEDGFVETKYGFIPVRK